MTVSVVSVKNRFTEFQSVPDKDVQFAIDQASGRADATNFGADLDDAVTNLAGHFIMVGIARRGGGQLPKSETIGPISVSYENPNSNVVPDPSDFTTTQYGQRYLDLLTLNIPAIFSI